MVVEDVLIDPPQGSQVRVRMVSAGICASDAHYVWGEQQLDNMPNVMGHEGAGVVESVGCDVVDLKPGDYVLTTFNPRCRACKSCKNPLTNVCRNTIPLLMGTVPNKRTSDGKALFGYCGLGTYSEYVLVEPSQVVKVSSALLYLRS